MAPRCIRVGGTLAYGGLGPSACAGLSPGHRRRPWQGLLGGLPVRPAESPASEGFDQFGSPLLSGDPPSASTHGRLKLWVLDLLCEPCVVSELTHTFGVPGGHRTDGPVGRPDSQLVGADGGCAVEPAVQGQVDQPQLFGDLGLWLVKERAGWSR